MSLLSESLAAHGGRERWEAARTVEAHVRSGGLALRSKLAAGPFRSYRTTVSVHEPRAVIDPYPRPGRRGVFEGDRVRIEDSATGATLAERADPRAAFPYGRRALRWDRLDALYFAGYALWNYLTFPFLLARPGVELTEGGRTVNATFPHGFPTHSREQAFHLDERGLLRQHDYTAEVFGGWAKAAHVCSEHTEFGWLPVPTRRRVTPRRRDGSPARAPVLVWLEVEGVAVPSEG